MVSCVPMKLIGRATPLLSLPRRPSSLFSQDSLILISKYEVWDRETCIGVGKKSGNNMRETVQGYVHMRNPHCEEPTKYIG